VPGLRPKAEAGHALFGTIDSWLLWNLSGGAKGDDLRRGWRYGPRECLGFL